MEHRAADTVGDPVELPGFGGTALVGAPGLELVGREELVAPDDLQLVVVDEVLGAQVGSALESDDTEPGGCQLVDHYAATGARADYTDIVLLTPSHRVGFSERGESSLPPPCRTAPPNMTRGAAPVICGTSARVVPPPEPAPALEAVSATVPTPTCAGWR